MQINIRTRLIQLAAPLALLALMVGTASAAFDAPVTLSGPGQDAQVPQVAMTPTGGALIVWRRSNGNNFVIEARSRSQAGKLGPVQTLSLTGGDASDPQVAITPTGAALVVWSRFDGVHSRVQARSRSAAGTLGPIQTLSPPTDALDPRVAISPKGVAIVVWRVSDLIQARVRSASGVFGPLETLNTRGSPVFGPVVGIADDHSAVVAWMRQEGSIDRVVARGRSASGALGPLQTVSQNGADTFNLDLAVDATGDALMVWQNRTATDERRILGRGRAASGVLGPVQSFSLPGSLVTQPDVAMQDDGDAMVVWVRNDRVEARTRAAAGTLGVVQPISPVAGFSSSPEVAYDNGGAAAFIWDYVTPEFSSRLQARSRSAAGALSPIQDLGFVGSLGGQAQIGMEAGKALAVWERPDNASDSRIVASQGP